MRMSPISSKTARHTMAKFGMQTCDVHMQDLCWVLCR